VLEAAESAGLLNGLAAPVEQEARSALGALPASIDTALLSILKGALERNVPAVLQWKPGPHVDLQVWESADNGVAQIGVLLTLPFGRDLGSSA
jgi:hypothetical protein